MHRTILILITFLLFFSGYRFKVGDVIDSHNEVAVYYNGNINHVSGRNMTRDGYNLGLKYQCVEFVKRYYYERFDHRMPNSYGHAKDYFDDNLEDIDFNELRGLQQFRNTRYELPKEEDILIYGGTIENPFGHVGIISCVGTDFIEIIQQNWGRKTRKEIPLVNYEGIITVADYDVKGWLRINK